MSLKNMTRSDVVEWLAKHRVEHRWDSKERRPITFNEHITRIDGSYATWQGLDSLVQKRAEEIFHGIFRKLAPLPKSLDEWKNIVQSY